MEQATNTNTNTNNGDAVRIPARRKPDGSIGAGLQKLHAPEQPSTQALKTYADARLSQSSATDKASRVLSTLADGMYAKGWRSDDLRVSVIKTLPEAQREARIAFRDRVIRITVQAMPPEAQFMLTDTAKANLPEGENKANRLSPCMGNRRYWMQQSGSVVSDIMGALERIDAAAKAKATADAAKAKAEAKGEDGAAAADAALAQDAYREALASTQERLAGAVKSLGAKAKAAKVQTGKGTPHALLLGRLNSAIAACAEMLGEGKAKAKAKAKAK